MSRIKLGNSTADVIYKMSDGNPGVLSVCMEFVQKTPIIDPDGIMGGLRDVLGLDTLEIYGSRIWLLYKDVCGQKIENVLALIRAEQLGQLEGVTAQKI